MQIIINKYLHSYCKPHFGSGTS